MAKAPKKAATKAPVKKPLKKAAPAKAKPEKTAPKAKSGDVKAAPSKAEKTSVFSKLGKLANSVAEVVTKSAGLSSSDEAKSVKAAKPIKESKPVKAAKEPVGAKSKPAPEITAEEKPVAETKAAKAKKTRAETAAAVAQGHLDEATKALEQRWQTLQRQSQNKTAVDYDMTKVYEPKTPLQHKVLGWGYILENKNDRLEVLFRTGIKILISNYKP